MWQTLLNDLIATGRYSTQGELVDALETHGQTVNQSSVSRELKKLGIHKVSGAYVLPVAAGLPPSVELLDATVSQSGPLVVLKTRPATAPILAQAVDYARIPGVLGTIAGDDTVFVACDGQGALPELERFLGRSLTRGADS